MKKKNDTDSARFDELMHLVHFIEGVSAEIQGIRNDEDIFEEIVRPFRKQRRYVATILLLAEDGKKLRIAASSEHEGKVNAAEKATGFRIKGFTIDLKKSSIYRSVVENGRSVQTNVGDIVEELMPKMLAKTINTIMGYKKDSCILAPLKSGGDVIGVLAMSSTELGHHLVPSVENMSRSISTVLMLAEEDRMRRHMEEMLREQNILLKEKQSALDKSIRLREDEKRELEDRVQTNVEDFLMPLLNRLRGKGSKLDAMYIDLIAENLKRLTSPFASNLSHKSRKLSRREAELCNMIADGLSTQRIADLLGLSSRTVEVHRNNIRHKLGIVERDANLQTYLQTLR